MKNISLHKYVDLFCSVLKKIVSDVTTPYFQEVGGVTQPLIFHQMQKIFSWYHVNQHKIS